MIELSDKISTMVETEASAFELFLTGRERSGQTNFIFFMDSETPLNMKILTDFTRHISTLIDEGDFDETPFTFEISSPGADRPLTNPKQFNKHCGIRFAITILDGNSFEAQLIGVANSIDTLEEHWMESWQIWLSLQKPPKIKKEPKKKVHRRFDEEPEEIQSNQTPTAIPLAVVSSMITEVPPLPACQFPTLIMEKFIPEKGKKTRSEIIAVDFISIKNATIILSFK
jgi:ribosome maturation factor RimP